MRHKWRNGSIITFIIIVIIANVLQSSMIVLTPPSSNSIENAISWAVSHVGNSSYVTIDNKTKYSIDPSTGIGNCANFVANTYGEPSYGYNSAIDLWNSTTINKHSGDINAPRGCLVFFDYSPYGHVALCLGDGEIVEAGGKSNIRESTISADNVGGLTYLGWAWPPSSWPGRLVGLTNPINP